MRILVISLFCTGFSFAVAAENAFARSAVEQIRSCPKTDAICVSEALIDRLEEETVDPAFAVLRSKLRETCSPSDAACTGLMVLKALNQTFRTSHEPYPPRPIPHPYPSSNVSCMKGSNGRFYPSKFPSGAIVGSTAWDAGHTDLASCSNTLPDPGSEMACLKASNSRYYPTRTDTAKIIGSTAWDAGHVSVASCKQTLGHRYQQYTCLKASNGRFYPTDLNTGVIVGSTAWDAGYTAFESCTEVLPR